MEGVSITIVIFVVIVLITAHNFYRWKKKN